jgi:hypothetical protein
MTIIFNEFKKRRGGKRTTARIHLVVAFPSEQHSGQYSHLGAEVQL